MVASGSARLEETTPILRERECQSQMPPDRIAAKRAEKPRGSLQALPPAAARASNALETRENPLNERFVKPALASPGIMKTSPRKSRALSHWSSIKKNAPTYSGRGVNSSSRHCPLSVPRRPKARARALASRASRPLRQVDARPERIGRKGHRSARPRGFPARRSARSSQTGRNRPRGPS